MKDVIKSILVILGAIVGVVFIIALAFGLSGLIWWGVGSFFVWAFGLNYIWTFWHGLAIAVIMSMLGGVFKITVKKED